MFFDRFGKKASSAQSIPTHTIDAIHASAQQEIPAESFFVRQRRAIALGLAVNFAFPIAALAETARMLTQKQPTDASTSSTAATPSPKSKLVTVPVQNDVPLIHALADVPTDPAAQYRKGREEFVKQDYAAAKADLSAAKDGGYKPSLFEESIDSMLEKIKQKDEVDAAKGATPAAAMAGPTTAPSVTVTPAPQRISAPSVTAAPIRSTGGSADQALEAAANYQKIKQQQLSYQAQQLLEKAKQEQSANRFTEALADYTSAADLDPNNQAAVAGRNEMQTRLGVGAATTGLQTTRTQVNERISAIQYAFDSAIKNADDAVASKNFNEARRQIDQARIARNTDPTIFTNEQLNRMDQVIANAEFNLERTSLEKSEADRRESSENASKTEQDRNAQAEKDRRQTVSGYIEDGRAFIQQGKYREALAVIEHIQALDPTNEYASSVRQIIEDKANLQEQRLHREAFDREFTRQLVDTEERKVPYDDIVRYSDKWPEISAMRDEEVKEDRGEGTEDQTLLAMLDRRLPELRFNANGFSDVIDFLRDVTGANIYVDWPALERANISRDAPVTARLRDIKFSKALELIFRSVQGEEDERKLGYTLDEGVITISTRRELNKNTVTRRYDINDLLFVAPDYNDAPSLDLTQQQNQQGGQGGGGGGGGQQNLFSNSNGGGQQNNNNDKNATREARIDEIKKYITDNVATTTWKDNGGDVGSISSSPLRAVLLITQTPENHKDITHVLDSLRASQALQVSIETRFLVVQRNYLEDIGVNANFSFNPLKNPADPTSGYWSSHFTPIPVTHTAVTDNSTFRDANGNIVPATSSNGSRTLDWQSNVGNASVPGSIAANPADYPNPLVIQGSYLDNFTVDFLVRAVQANQKTTNLTAPRLTLFSGQRAEIIVETQQAYVSDLTPVVAPGAGLFDPQVSTTVAVGVILTVLATVSPDRKYVYLDLQPQLARLRALVPFSVSAVIPGVVSNGGVTQSQTITGTLQLPTIDTTIVKTSVSVPDGATLLLGGQTLAGETEREQGVPILSKIPFLKRLFTNRATSTDEQILLILVKPTILIQHEQEQKQFPLLSTKVNQ